MACFGLTFRTLQDRYEFRKFEVPNPTMHNLVNKRLTVGQIIDMSAAMYRLRTEAFRLLLEIGDAGLGLWNDNTTD